MLRRCVECLLIVLTAYCVNSQYDVDDFCLINDSDGRYGQCRLIKDCPAAYEAIRNRIIPQTCGFDKATPIVCCEINLSSSLTTVSNLPTTPKPRNRSGVVTNELRASTTMLSSPRATTTTIRSTTTPSCTRHNSTRTTTRSHNVRTTTSTRRINATQSTLLSTIKTTTERHDVQTNLYTSKLNLTPNRIATTAKPSIIATKLPAQLYSTRATVSVTEEATSTEPKKVKQMIPELSEPLPLGGKSRRKCQQYGQYVYINATSLLSNVTHMAEECVASTQELIVGGIRARAKEFPHMALIGFENPEKEVKWLCDGALISENFVLTAAHCLSSREYGEPTLIRLGELVMDTNEDDSSLQEFSILNQFQHPKYKQPSLYHDMGLLRLNRSATLNVYVRPACLNTDYNPTGQRLVATGWDTISNLVHMEKSLLKLYASKASHMECNASYASSIGRQLPNGIEDATQVCATFGNQDINTLNSGAPLQVLNGELYCTFKIVGITSFRGRYDVPHVYTRISAYVKWIEDIVWPDLK